MMRKHHNIQYGGAEKSAPLVLKKDLLMKFIWQAYDKLLGKKVKK